MRHFRSDNLLVLTVAEGAWLLIVTQGYRDRRQDAEIFDDRFRRGRARSPLEDRRGQTGNL
jgi:hypothetical protein